MNGVIGTETAAQGLWQSEKKGDILSLIHI